MGKYTTTQGDTWDKISLELLGDERFMHKLIDVNPDYREMVIFPANCELAVPPVNTQNRITFPPWRSNT